MLFASHCATKKFEARYEETSKALNLSGQSLTGEDMPALADFLDCHENITELTLNNNHVGSGLRYLACKRITHLSIAHNELTDAEVVAFASALLQACGPQNNLILLDLDNNQIGDAAACAMAQFDQPLSLYLDNNLIGYDGACALAENTKWFKIVALLGNPLPAEAVEILKERFDGVRGLGLFNDPVDPSTPLPAEAVEILTEHFDGVRGLELFNDPVDPSTPSCCSCFFS